jgi:hypothetical protein
VVGDRPHDLDREAVAQVAPLDLLVTHAKVHRCCPPLFCALPRGAGGGVPVD